AVLLFFYNQNSIYVSIRPVLITAAFCALTTVLFWLFALWIIRNAFSVSLLCLIIWFGIFFESLLHQVIITMFGRIAYFYILWLLMSFTLAYVLRKIKAKSAFSFIFCAFISVFFVISAVTSATIPSFALRSHNATLKTDFVVDTNENDKPNIYWIHCDGMLSFEAVEKHYGDRQAEFRDALSKRGFLINETASFFACHKTTVAVPALMSPYFYDAYLSDFLRDRTTAFIRATSYQTQALLKDVRLKNETIGAFEAAGYTTNTVALLDQFFFPTTDTFYYPNDMHGVDFFRAIIAHGTYPVELAKMGQLSEEDTVAFLRLSETNNFLYTFFRPGASLLAFIVDNQDSRTFRFVLNSLNYDDTVSELSNDPSNDKSTKYPSSFDQLEISSPFSSASAGLVDAVLSGEKIDEIFLGSTASVSHTYFVDAIAHIQNDSSRDVPHFTFLMNFMFHDPYLYDENGVRLTSPSYNDASAYISNHVYFSKVLINVIDLILENDPDAVIILQSDHGINCMPQTAFDDAFGEENYDINLLLNSTMSAIRVPGKYQNGDEEYAMSTPLNISRYLVNRFVGKNYDYRTEDT
ncbi:MAG: hypothetical protein JW780_05735, partial [Clostridiales bacterium]|nr:hypothetical protein [Clostridiales bacterium]